jgi:hypothetical protein
MAETERFERRLAEALERYAQEVPTRVDASGLVRSIAESEARRAWWRPIQLPWPTRVVPAVRLAIALAALLALVGALAILAQRLAPGQSDAVLTGRMECSGADWLAAAAPVALDCTLDLHDDQVTGTARIRLDAATDLGAVSGRSGTIDVDGRWTGALTVTTAPNGITVGAAVLVGRADTGETIRMRLLSTDGLRWGLLGSRASGESSGDAGEGG